MKFFKCKKCANMVIKLVEGPCTPACCGEEMDEIIPGTVDAAKEKHVPAVAVEGNKVSVKVGEVEHPMMEKHFIQWILLETEQGFQVKKLDPEKKPEAEFLVAEGDKAVAAYESCNLHGIWKKEI